MSSSISAGNEVFSSSSVFSWFPVNLSGIFLKNDAFLVMTRPPLVAVIIVPLTMVTMYGFGS